MNTTAPAAPAMSHTESLHREISELLFELMECTRDYAYEVMAEHELTVTQGFALHHLSEPRRMRELADELGFDASHITGVIDRLEARGLVERQPDPADRRVKLLTVTPAGTALRQQIEERVWTRQPMLDRLSTEQCRALKGLLQRMLTTDEDLPTA